LSDARSLIDDFETRWQKLKKKLRSARTDAQRHKSIEKLLELAGQVEGVRQEADLMAWARGSTDASAELLTWKEKCQTCQKTYPNRYMACCALVSLAAFMNARRTDHEVFMNFIAEIDPTFIDALARFMGELEKFVEGG